MEASRSSMYSCIKIYVKNFKKQRFCKQLNMTKQMTNAAQNFSIASMGMDMNMGMSHRTWECFVNKKLITGENKCLK
jgi:hypothetical protein